MSAAVGTLRYWFTRKTHTYFRLRVRRLRTARRLSSIGVGNHGEKMLYSRLAVARVRCLQSVRVMVAFLALCAYTCYNSLTFQGFDQMLVQIFSQFSAFGFSGSRSSVPAGCSVAASLVPASSQIFVGCAAGVDGFFRSAFPAARVFSVSSGVWGSGRGAFAGRSSACVLAVLAAGGLWVAFPSSPCPPGLLPSASSSRCFSGSGSGSWASLAFALGRGVPCLVFLGSLPCPVGWGLSPVPGHAGWFACSSVLGRAPVQLSLF